MVNGSIYTHINVHPSQLDRQPPVPLNTGQRLADRRTGSQRGICIIEESKLARSIFTRQT